ncbi:MAG: arsenite efflux transporter metallochaperone ArsD [Bacillota bacterium]
MQITVYDPAMCCSTGLCGPSPSPELTRVAADLHRLANQGIIVKRHNLAQEPQAFVEDERVQRLLKEKGPDVLPVVVVDNEVRVTGRYPSTSELEAWLSEKQREDGDSGSTAIPVFHG